MLQLGLLIIYLIKISDRNEISLHVQCLTLNPDLLHVLIKNMNLSNLYLFVPVLTSRLAEVNSPQLVDPKPV